MRVNKTSIFLTNLKAYNRGELVGDWIELGIPDEELSQHLKRIAGDDEHFITDYEANFEIAEYENIFDLNDFVSELNQLNKYELKAVEYLLSEGYDKEEALERYQDVEVFEGTYLDMAYRYVDEGLLGEIPENVAKYFDYKALARDLENDYTELDGYLFRML